MHMGAMPAAAAQQVNISLIGRIAQDGTGFLQARAGWQFRSDGTKWEYTGGAYIQTDSLTDWAFPRTAPLFDPADYEIRCNVVSGSGLDGSSDATGAAAWLSLTTNRIWRNTCNRFCVENTTIAIDIRHATTSAKNTESSVFDAAACMASDTFYISIEAT